MRAKIGQSSLRIVSWNMRRSQSAWDLLFADPLLDVALLQEAVRPQKRVLWSSPPIEEPWRIQGYEQDFCAAVVGLSNRVKGQPLANRRIGDPEHERLAVSLPGTLAAAEVVCANGERITIVSVYAAWENRLHMKHQIFADASAHRIISDLSALIYSQHNHRIIVAGDWNIFFGYGDRGSSYWKARYNTVFARMEALGLRFVGPQYPQGIKAESWPPYLPASSKNVPTFRKSKNNPASATDQLDFVFASTVLHDRLNVRALNTPELWGPSDHCRVEIVLL
jgi:hypothetical protein